MYHILYCGLTDQCPTYCTVDSLINVPHTVLWTHWSMYHILYCRLTDQCPSRTTHSSTTCGPWAVWAGCAAGCSLNAGAHKPYSCNKCLHSSSQVTVVRTCTVASSPGHSQILSCSSKEKSTSLHGCEIKSGGVWTGDEATCTDFRPRLQVHSLTAHWHSHMYLIMHWGLSKKIRWAEETWKWSYSWTINEPHLSMWYN